ncbi:MAG: hypothetical protein VYE22_22325 [Myxococcota bacterium]|nr:hypothetical protein [Myxococcota bacterium]
MRRVLRDVESPTLIDGLNLMMERSRVQKSVDIQAIDHALGRRGSQPRPLEAGLRPDERRQLLGDALCFPDRELPTGELAEWAVALLGLEKDVTVRAAVAALERATAMAPVGSPDIDFVRRVIDAIHAWLDSPRDIADLRRLGELWWTLVRHPPDAARTPLGDAACMAWWVAGYDPEGWGDPPEDAAQLEIWLSEAADNRGGIVDVFSLVQQAVAAEEHGTLVESVRAVVSAWRAESD